MHKPARDTSNSRYHGSYSQDCVSFQKWNNHVHGMAHKTSGLIYMNFPCSLNFLCMYWKSVISHVVR